MVASMTDEIFFDEDYFSSESSEHYTKMDIDDSLSNDIYTTATAIDNFVEAQDLILHVRKCVPKIKESITKRNKTIDELLGRNRPDCAKVLVIRSDWPGDRHDCIVHIHWPIRGKGDLLLD
jgi:hypothetical protein